MKNKKNLFLENKIVFFAGTPEAQSATPESIKEEKTLAQEEFHDKYVNLAEKVAGENKEPQPEGQIEDFDGATVGPKTGQIEGFVGMDIRPTEEDLSPDNPNRPSPQIKGIIGLDIRKMGERDPNDKTTIPPVRMDDPKDEENK